MLSIWIPNIKESVDGSGQQVIDNDTYKEPLQFPEQNFAQLTLYQKALENGTHCSAIHKGA